jgi:hypothetical protein
VHKLACALLCEWCDAILLATRAYGTTQASDEHNERVLRCVNHPLRLAGNRYDIPETISLDWPTLAGHIHNGMMRKENQNERVN